MWDERRHVNEVARAGFSHIFKSGAPTHPRSTPHYVDHTLDRAVMMKFVVNRFLQEAAMAAGRDPAQASRFDVDERSVVTMMLLAEEAKKNGIVVSDAAINDFLAKETNGQVGADQFEQIMGGLRAGGSGVSQHDLFEALR